MEGLEGMRGGMMVTMTNDSGHSLGQPGDQDSTLLLLHLSSSLHLDPREAQLLQLLFLTSNMSSPNGSLLGPPQAPHVSLHTQQSHVSSSAFAHVLIWTSPSFQSRVPVPFLR